MAKAKAVKKETSTVEISEYKGKPILCLNPDVDNAFMRFQFGMNKAKLILEHIDDIREFVASHDTATDEEPKKKGKK